MAALPHPPALLPAPLFGEDVQLSHSWCNKIAINGWLCRQQVIQGGEGQALAQQVAREEGQPARLALPAEAHPILNQRQTQRPPGEAARGTAAAPRGQRAAVRTSRPPHPRLIHKLESTSYIYHPRLGPPRAHPLHHQQVAARGTRGRLPQRVAHPVGGRGEAQVAAQGHPHAGRLGHAVQEDHQEPVARETHAPHLLPALREVLTQHQPPRLPQGVLVQGQQLGVEQQFQLLLGQGLQRREGQWGFQADPAAVLGGELGERQLGQQWASYVPGPAPRVPLKPNLPVESCHHGLPGGLERTCGGPCVGDLARPALHSLLALVVQLNHNPPACLHDEVAEQTHPRPRSHHSLAVLDPHVVHSPRSVGSCVDLLVSRTPHSSTGSLHPNVSGQSQQQSLAVYLGNQILYSRGEFACVLLYPARLVPLPLPVRPNQDVFISLGRKPAGQQQIGLPDHCDLIPVAVREYQCEGRGECESVIEGSDPHKNKGKDYDAVHGYIIIMLARIKASLKTHKKKLLAALSFLAAGYFLYRYLDDDQSLVKVSSFLQAVEASEVDNILIDGDRIYFSSHTSDWYQTIIGNIPIQSIYDLLMAKNISFENKEQLINNEIVAVAGTCLVTMGAFKYMIRELNKPSISQVEYKSSIYGGGASFDDYYGGEDIKEKFREVIDFLNDSERYEQMGARIRRGIMFYGPPGTGKTLLARALANEAGCSFIKVVASEFQEVFVGVGPKRIRELFASARSCKNGCIIFVDEIDALGSRLNHLRDSHETTTTINQFLSEMDGFYPNEKVLIVAATNRIDLVDHAILRAGRFDLKIFIPLPDPAQRRGIFKKLLGKKVGQLNNVSEETVGEIVRRSEDWCGADLETLINESIYKAIEDRKEFVSSEHVLSALEELAHRK